jgi:cardiolipin synthase
MEYGPGLLHAKTLTVDGQLCLMGSANLDRRSFELNFENNLLFFDDDLATDIRARQQSYIARSVEITLAEVEGWSWRKRLLNNLVATLGPVL